jgi:SAM-dependent methyltransferase
LINQNPNIFGNNFNNLSNNIQEYNITDFERRINVDLYGYFEYFHPGYIIQALLIATFLDKNINSTTNILDIGSGPGQHLTLINQIINNDILYTCVEPSSKSISFLEQVKNVQTIIQNDFLTYEFKNHFEFILSVGSSHHIDLYDLLNSSYNLLNKNGFFIVSDEFIFPFKTKYQREKNLILHHTYYMIEAMIEIKDLSKNEQKLYDLLREDVPYIRYLTINDEVTLAKDITISLFNSIKKFDIKKDLINNLISYYLFMILELEALVAGLDYEEERKTSNENFINIANNIGFSVVHNICFHPTSKDSGTYMIVLQKVQ